MMMTYLDVDVLLAWIRDEEGEGVFPHGTVGAVARLRTAGGGA